MQDQSGSALPHDFFLGTVQNVAHRCSGLQCIMLGVVLLKAWIHMPQIYPIIKPGRSIRMIF